MKGTKCELKLFIFDSWVSAEVRNNPLHPSFRSSTSQTVIPSFKTEPKWLQEALPCISFAMPWRKLALPGFQASNRVHSTFSSFFLSVNTIASAPFRHR